ncbi:MAG: sorbitol-6-phosphate dehydrogenase [Chloroflexi bacterium]|nr:sorbitol-6-phosphate dehydrogenase [Chloroflexota bacterium]
MKRLAGKSVLITGAAQGLGEALSERLAQEGADVAICDIMDEPASQLAERLAREYGVKAIWQHMDVTDLAQCDAAVDAAVAAFGKLDIVVSNAGILFSGPLLELDPGRWKKVIDVNVVGYYNTARAAVRVMLPNRRGTVVQINSKSGKKGSAKNSAYATSKFAGIGLTQSLALEFAEVPIRFNAICPGNLLDSPLWVNSLFKQYAANQGITEAQVRQKYIDQVPMKRGCTYEDIANMAVFLASDESAYMTGQAINVTGGQEMR